MITLSLPGPQTTVGRCSLLNTRLQVLAMLPIKKNWGTEAYEAVLSYDFECIFTLGFKLNCLSASLIVDSKTFFSGNLCFFCFHFWMPEFKFHNGEVVICLTHILQFEILLAVKHCSVAYKMLMQLAQPFNEIFLATWKWYFIPMFIIPMLEARGSNCPKCRAYAVMAICLISTPFFKINK